jgi:hypothetical protein
MQKTLKKYTGYATYILKEFMSPKELKELTRRYNEAKARRLAKKEKLLCTVCGHPVVAVKDRR